MKKGEAVAEFFRVLALPDDLAALDGASAAEVLADFAGEFLDGAVGKLRGESRGHNDGLAAAARFFFSQHDARGAWGGWGS